MSWDSMRCKLTWIYLIVSTALLLSCNSGSGVTPEGNNTHSITPTVTLTRVIPPTKAINLPDHKPTTAPTMAPIATPNATRTALKGLYGGELIIGTLVDIPHRDIHEEGQYTLVALGPGISYSRMLRLKTGSNAELYRTVIECDLCQTWQLNSDFTYEFQLRPSIQWHDIDPLNGRFLTANDIVYSYERIIKQDSGHNTSLKDRGFKEFQAISETTVQASINFIDSDALLSLADGRHKIIAPEIEKQYGDLKQSPVIGTGPWIWESSTPGEGSTFMANPNYFEPDLPFIDQISTKLIMSDNQDIPDDNKRLAAIKTGLIDATIFSGNSIDHLTYNQQNMQLHGSTPVSSIAIILNTQNHLLTNPKVRESIFKAIDPWDYIDVFWGGVGSAHIGMPAGMLDWRLSKQEMRDQYFANPSEARSLLNSQSTNSKQILEITVAEFDDRHLNLAKRIADDLNSVGFSTDLIAVHPSQFNTMLLESPKQYQIAIGTLPPSQSPNEFLVNMIHSRGPVNLSDHRDGYLDLLIEKQASELDQSIRTQQLGDIQRHILEHGYMFSPVVASSHWISLPKLRGFYPTNRLYEYHFWAQAWLEE